MILERHQVFRWQSPDGQEVCWSINEAMNVIGDRSTDPRASLTPELVVHALSSNSLVHELDKEYAMTTDLSQPLIATVSPLEKQEGKLVLIIIDGWHRILKAFLTHYEGALQVYVLSENEEKLCRVERIQ